jgi:phage tail-like protein
VSISPYAAASLGGTAASTTVSAARGASADSAFRLFGLSMRFKVTFSNGTGVDGLGEWASCKGLKVDFKTETVKQGGNYNGETKLPTDVVYSPVVLERAMEAQSSQSLQAWLGRLVQSWVNYDGTAALSPPSGIVHIVLQDVYQSTVASWTLNGAYPVSWSGPTLDAKQNSVALETLTIEHHGFLPPAR